MGQWLRKSLCMDNNNTQPISADQPHTEARTDLYKRRKANIHDKYFRASMALRPVATELLEYHLPRHVLESIDLTTLQVEPTHFVDEDLELSVSDMVFRVHMGDDDGYIAVIAEHQSTADKHMLIRTQRYKLKVMEYYAQQAKEVDDFLTDKPYPAVYCLVFYHGNNTYPYPTHLAEQICAPKALAALVSEPSFQLIDLNEKTDEELKRQEWLGIISLVFKYSRRKNFPDYYIDIVQGLRKVLPKNGGHYTNLTLKYIECSAELDEELFTRILQEEFPDEVRGEVMTVVEQVLQRGRREGIQEGVQKGRQEEKQAIAMQMLQDGMSYQKIAALTGLTISAIRTLNHG